MQPIFSFKGIYKDAFGEEEIIVFSDGKYLSTTIRGIELDGQGFDNLSLTNPDLVTDRDQIPLYGNNKENLHDCYFNIEMPFLVEIKGEIQDVKSSYETWNSKVVSNHFKSSSSFQLLIDDVLYQNQENDLYNAIEKIVACLPAHIKLKCCYTCKLSFYEPQERPQMGEILCFKGIKKEFLQIDWGEKPTRTFYKLDLNKKKTMHVTECYYCEEYIS